MDRYPGISGSRYIPLGTLLEINLYLQFSLLKTMSGSMLLRLDPVELLTVEKSSVWSTHDKRASWCSCTQSMPFSAMNTEIEAEFMKKKVAWIPSNRRLQWSKLNHKMNSEFPTWNHCAAVWWPKYWSGKSLQQQPTSNTAHLKKCWQVYLFRVTCARFSIS